MTERQQSIAPRERRPKPAAIKRPKGVASNRRPPNVARWVRRAALAAALGGLVAGYFAASGSTVFALKRVEVSGARRVPVRDLERTVRETAGSRLLEVDLDAVRRELERGSYVRQASVVRVLPDTLRVRIEEREAALVVRGRSGRLAWVDRDGRLLEEYAPEAGVPMPPPLSGFEDEDRSERAAADNRDRVARYLAVREALGDGDLWEKIDDVDIRYPQDVKLHLADRPIVVRVGDKDFRGRLTTALGLLDAVRRGDVYALAGYNVADIGRLLASSESIDFIDVTRGNSVTLAYGSPTTTVRRND